MDVRISTETVNTVFTRVLLDGEYVGSVTYETSYRAPKKYAARAEGGDDLGAIIGPRFTSAQEAAFFVAYTALQERHKVAVLASLGMTAEA